MSAHTAQNLNRCYQLISTSAQLWRTDQDAAYPFTGHSADRAFGGVLRHMPMNIRVSFVATVVVVKPRWPDGVPSIELTVARSADLGANADKT